MVSTLPTLFLVPLYALAGSLVVLGISLFFFLLGIGKPESYWANAAARLAAFISIILGLAAFILMPIVRLVTNL